VMSRGSSFRLTRAPICRLSTIRLPSFHWNFTTENGDLNREGAKDAK
jgi:hypothetical protein